MILQLNPEYDNYQNLHPYCQCYPDRISFAIIFFTLKDICKFASKRCDFPLENISSEQTFCLGNYCWLIVLVNHNTSLRVTFFNSKLHSS